MRSFLLRGKRKDNGEWLESETLLSFEDQRAEARCPMKLRFMPLTGVTVYISIDENGNIKGFKNPEYYEVFPETVGYCTGLTDKNGTRIFEGDIVKIENSFYECFWDDGNLEFGLKNPEESFSLVYAPHDIEVVGNIHDNPEKGGVI